MSTTTAVETALERFTFALPTYLLDQLTVAQRAQVQADIIAAVRRAAVGEIEATLFRATTTSCDTPGCLSRGVTLHSDVGCTGRKGRNIIVLKPAWTPRVPRHTWEEIDAMPGNEVGTMTVGTRVQVTRDWVGLGDDGPRAGDTGTLLLVGSHRVSILLDRNGQAWTDCDAALDHMRPLHAEIVGEAS